MAVKIRLRRLGAHKRPFYRIIVANSRSPRDGRFIEELGYYNPLTDPATVKIDAEKARKWLGTGAQPTDTVRALFNKAGISKPGKDELLSADNVDISAEGTNVVDEYLPDEIEIVADLADADQPEATEIVNDVADAASEELDILSDNESIAAETV
jgi:small subunit ribosomal protein S16